MSAALIQIETTAREISAAWGRLGKPRAKRFKGAEFRSIVLRFKKLVYELEWSDFKEIEHFEHVEKLIQVMIAITEAWVFTQYDSRHTSECQAFGDIINDLRVALEGVRHGLPPNPKKRLAREEINARAEADLFEILVPTT
jgi:hypothetical protein